jgi:hypothetical protein
MHRVRLFNGERLLSKPQFRRRKAGLVLYCAVWCGILILVISYWREIHWIYKLLTGILLSILVPPVEDLWQKYDAYRVGWGEMRKNSET